MKKKKAKAKVSAPNNDNNDEDIVLLKPVLGVKPGVYLTVLYATVLVLLLFFILIFPGMVKYGSDVRFTSTPPGGSILVDGVRIGATPFTSYVSAGKHEITIRKPYFKTYTGTVSVPGRLFFSLVAPARMRVAETLSLDDKNGLVQNAAREFASWAIIGEAHGQYQFPPVLTQAAGDLYAGTKAEIRPAPGQAGHLLNAALLDVQSPSLLRDYVHALALDFSSGGVAGPLQFTQMLSKIIQLNKDSQGFPLWLSVVLSSDASSKLTGSSWYANYLKNYRESMRSGSQLASRQLPGPKQLVVDGVPFLGVAGGTFVMGQDEASTTSTDPMLVPSKIAVSSFYMMPTEVSRGMFARFLRANPEWLPGNRNSLEAAGKVTAGYLQGWSDSGVPPSGTADLPVTGVSAVAAGAYAAWLNSQQPGAVGGYEVRLPTEAEWEYAARVNRSRSQDGVFQDTVAATPREPQPVGSGKAGSIGIFDLLGNVWEWTASAYRPAEPPLTRVGANGDSAGGVALADPLAAALPTAHRTVKGGSFANRSDMVSPATRGSLPPDWCTPYLGFRVVIAPKL